MIFKPKISHQKPIKPPLKADFNAYFTKKRMIFTPIYKICATPKGPLWVRFPPGVPKAHPLLLQGVCFWYFNRRGPAAQGAAVRPDAVGTRAPPEVFPPVVGIKIGLYQKILLSSKKE